MEWIAGGEEDRVFELLVDFVRNRSDEFVTVGSYERSFTQSSFSLHFWIVYS